MIQKKRLFIMRPFQLPENKIQKAVRFTVLDVAAVLWSWNWSPHIWSRIIFV
jgi:hypothetical protein